MKGKHVQSVQMILACTLLNGCAYPTFTKTGYYTGEERAPDCDFYVVTKIPGDGYKEIGVVDFHEIDVGMERAKEISSQFVCANGGNAILLERGEDRSFISATVLYVELEEN